MNDRPFGKYVMRDEVVQYFKNWFTNEEVNEILYSIPVPPSHTTIRFKPEKSNNFDDGNNENNRKVESRIPPELYHYLLENPPQEDRKKKWNLQMLDAIDDILFINDETFKKETVKCEYPLVAVDQNCAAALLRGAHLMAVGVLGIQRKFGISSSSSSPSNDKVDCKKDNINNDGDDDNNDDNNGDFKNIGYKKGGYVSVVLDINKTLDRGFDLSSPDSPLPQNAPFIGNGIALLQRKEIFNAKSGDGIAVKMIETVHSSPSLHSFVENSSSLFLQNFPSSLAAHILDPKEGERIFDMCAAPGGKTTHIAQLANDKCEIYAAERSKNKLNDFQKLLNRLNLKSITLLHLDSTKALSSIPKKKGMNVGFEANSFDKILLDPPCSGVGLRPRFSDLYTTVDILKQHAVYQKKLFSVAYELLKVGGFMVYSTCTINPEENEELVSWALTTYPNLELLPQPPKFIHGTFGLMNTSLGDKAKLVQRFTPRVVTEDNPFSHSAFFIAYFCKLK